MKWEPIPFNIRMADNRTVVPKGLIKHAKVKVGGMDYLVNLVVITMQTPTQDSYQVLLGRPWLRDAKVKHDWNRDKISLKKGKKKVYIEFGQNKTTRIAHFTPLHAETYNMAEGLEDDEEEYLLQQNPNLVPLFLVHLDKVLQKQKMDPGNKKGKRKQAKPEDLELRARECGQEDFENLQAWIKTQKDKEQEEVTRVKQDQLEEIDLGEEGEGKRVRVSAELEKQFKEQLVQLLKEYRDVFAWTYTDMEGIDPKFYEHKINLKEGAVPVKQQRYRMNPNYAKQVKEEIDRLLRVGFIYPVEKATWISPIVIVPKKNMKIRVCVDYRRLNAATIPDPFPLPFTDSLLDEVAGKEMYTFLDGFSGYNQVKMAPEDRDKTAFITEWGVFVATVMMFGLKNAPATFQRMVQEIFYDYLTDFMKVFVDDFSVAGERAKHLFQLRLCLQRCRDTRLKLNPAKCAFAVKSGILLGHIVSKEGLSIDPDKVKAIQEMKPPGNPKELERFMGKVKWHTRFVRYLAHVACPLYQLTRKDALFAWTAECQCSFELLKKMLTKAPVMVSPDWTKIFHVYTDASDRALGGTLMQERTIGYLQPIYYASKSMTKTEKNYNTTEREALGIIYAVAKFRHYLLGNKFVLHVDHQALIYIVNKASLVGKMAR